jgi:hypothetical protein
MRYQPPLRRPDAAVSGAILSSGMKDVGAIA